MNCLFNRQNILFIYFQAVIDVRSFGGSGSLGEIMFTSGSIEVHLIDGSEILGEIMFT